MKRKQESDRETLYPLYSVITHLETRGNITTRLKEICAYADDIEIIWRTKQILIDIFCKLKHEALNAGLIVNNNKTKYLHCNRKTIQPTYIDTGEDQFEQVNWFKYLRTVVNTDSSIEEEIKEKIAAENRAFHNIIYNKPTRCNSGSTVFIKNYKYALHVSDALCVHLQEHYKL